MAILILVRHGESVWNHKGLWTGLTDVDLSATGRDEARRVASFLKDIHPQIAFTSTLKRARQTLEEILEELEIQHIPIYENSALNERDYGDFTGKNKWDLEKEYGKEQFLKWRRGWDEPIPGGETLKDVYGRVIPYYKEHILPKLISGKNVIVCAHGNSLRALVKYLDNLSNTDISNLEIKYGEADIYKISSSGKVIYKEIRVPH